MDLELLRTFVALTESPTMTEAAQRRRVTKSALSQQLKILEARMGISLFERGGRRGLTPTPAAIDLASSLRHAFTIADDAVHALREAHGKVEGEVRIGAPRPFAQVKLADTFGRLLSQHEGLVLDLSFGTPSELEARLLAREIDLAVLTRSAENDSIIDSAPIFHETFELVASPKYLARHGTPKTSDDLAAHRFVVFDRDQPMHDAWWRATFGGRTKKRSGGGIVIARAATLDMMLALVRSGACMSVLPNYFLENVGAPAALSIVKIPRAKRRAMSSILLAWRRGAPVTARFSAVKSAILATLAKP